MQGTTSVLDLPYYKGLRLYHLSRLARPCHLQGAMETAAYEGEVDVPEEAITTIGKAVLAG